MEMYSGEGLDVTDPSRNDVMLVAVQGAEHHDNHKENVSYGAYFKRRYI